MNNLITYYRSSPGGLYKGCAIGDDSLSGMLRDIKQQRNLRCALASWYMFINNIVIKFWQPDFAFPNENGTQVVYNSIFRAYTWIINGTPGGV